MLKHAKDISALVQGFAAVVLLYDRLKPSSSAGHLMVDTVASSSWTLSTWMLVVLCVSLLVTTVLSIVSWYQPRSTGGALTIHSAKWGPIDRSQAVDITNEVRSRVKNGTLDIPVDYRELGHLGGAFAGKAKVLLVEWSAAHAI